MHPRTQIQTIRQYFDEILPENINCIDAVFYFRSIYENFEEFGLTLSEYALSVKNNKRQCTQAKKSAFRYGDDFKRSNRTVSINFIFLKWPYQKGSKNLQNMK